MKKIVVVLMIAVVATTVAFGQMKKSKNNSVETEIIALEKQAWEEWKKGNKKFVEGFVADDAFYVYTDGVMNKSQVIEAVGSCAINSYSLDGFKFQLLDKNSALVSYTAKQDVVCGGKPAPAEVRSTSVYVKKGGKWLNTFYAETEVAPDSSSVESQIIALEKAGWEAWKNKDADFFREFLTDEAINVNSGGVSSKSQFIESLGDCDVKSFSLKDFKFQMLDKNSALVTFTGTQDAVCGGEKAPSAVRATSVYVRRGGKWLNSFYTEVEVTQENGSVESQVIALEKTSWEAFKNKNGSWFQNNLADNYTFVNSDGTLKKSQIVEFTVSGCEVKSYSLDNFKFVMLAKDSALVTYTAMQDTVCGGNAFPKKVNASAVYVMRGGKWLSALHMQSGATDL